MDSKRKKILIAPSLLAADFAFLASEIRKVEKAGCDMLHLDIMDGHFVPNITIGPFVVKAIRNVTRLPLDTHLMIENPEKFIPSFVEAGSNHITVHYEACRRDLKKVLKLIRSMGVTSGISLKPKTPLAKIVPFLPDVDRVLFMTVNPGFGGQAFIPQVTRKIRLLKKDFCGDIQVDGGINKLTSKIAVEAGANILVAGTSIFGQSNVRKAIEELRRID